MTLGDRLSPLWRLLRGRLWLWELSAVAWVLLMPYLMSAHGHLDWSHHALGRDFVNYWTAGHLVVEHQVASIFRPGAFLAAEHRLFDPILPFHFWSYPPTALFLVTPLGLVPYLPALILWSLFGLLLLILTARRFFVYPAERALLVCAPAVAMNIAMGQNGAITAALMLGGLALWRRRPGWAGVLFGLLVFKPQLGLLIPIAVIAARRWKTLAWAAAGGAGLTLLSAPVFGLEAWRGFLGPTLGMQTIMLKQGAGPFQWMMPSTFMALRVVGLSYPIALMMQAPVSLLAAWRVWSVYRPGIQNQHTDDELKGAVLIMASVMATPQSFNYDLIPAAAAALILWRRDQNPWGRGLALAIWALPILMIALQAAYTVDPRLSYISRLAMVAPLILIAGTGRLYWLARPSRVASPSTAGQSASNT